MMARKTIVFVATFLVVIGVLCHSGCRKKTDPLLSRFTIISQIQNDPESPFYINFSEYPPERASLPVGVFDSGTGGLTVLSALLNADGYNNLTREQGSDQISDFQKETFIYLGDKANMPYGKYDSEGKSEFLQELIIKDVRFLLGRKYYRSPMDRKARRDKEPVKVIVIACNTATAFGLQVIKKSLSQWGLDIGVIGIIDAGAEAAVESLPGERKQHVIGVMATEGTCATGGYPEAIRQFYHVLYDRDTVTVYQQPGYGIAAAIDGDINYIDSGAREVRGKDRYHGPRLDHPKYPIKMSLWEQYHFSFGNQLLLKKNKDGIVSEIELNSIENYIRYHVTHLVNRVALESKDCILDAVILGCTHYPFYKEEIKAHLMYLRGLNSRFERLISSEIVIVDPSDELAGELYRYLLEKRLLNMNGKSTHCFFISVPNPDLESNVVNSDGAFPFSYKYGRSINTGLVFVKQVPFATQWLGEDVVTRIREKLPSIYHFIFEFQQEP